MKSSNPTLNSAPAPLLAPRHHGFASFPGRIQPQVPPTNRETIARLASGCMLVRHWQARHLRGLFSLHRPNEFFEL
jgi:hypothetical protein